MPTENTDDKKFTESLDNKAKTVDIDTSGPGAEVIVPEDKDESVVDAKEKEATVILALVQIHHSINLKYFLIRKMFQQL